MVEKKDVAKFTKKSKYLFEFDDFIDDKILLIDAVEFCPAAYINSFFKSGRAQNATFKIKSNFKDCLKESDVVTIVATKRIEPREEILVDYGINYHKEMEKDSNH